MPPVPPEMNRGVFPGSCCDHGMPERSSLVALGATTPYVTCILKPFGRSVLGENFGKAHIR